MMMVKRKTRKINISLTIAAIAVGHPSPMVPRMFQVACAQFKASMLGTQVPQLVDHGLPTRMPYPERHHPEANLTEIRGKMGTLITLYYIILH